MKNIYKIKLILLALVVFSSCAVNDDDPVQNLVSKTVLSLDTAFERASSDSYDLVVNVDGDLPYSSRLTYTLDGEEMFVDIDARSETAIIPVDMSGVAVRVVTITKIATLYASAAGYDVSVSGSNNKTIIAGADVGNGGDMYAQMTWNSGVDLDMILTRDAPPQAPYHAIPDPIVVDFSGYYGPFGNYGPLESVTLPSFEAEGDYSISIVPYEGFTAPIECNLIIVAGDMAYDFTGSVANRDGASVGLFGTFYNTVDEFAACVKIGTGAASTYTAVNKL